MPRKKTGSQQASAFSIEQTGSVKRPDHSASLYIKNAFWKECAGSNRITQHIADACPGEGAANLASCIIEWIKMGKDMARVQDDR